MINLQSLIVLGGWLAIVLLASFLSTKYFPKRSEISRKIVHIGSGPLIPLAWYLNVSSEIAIGISFMITITLFINHKKHWIPTFESVERKSYGTIVYGLSITILLFCFWTKDPSAACAGVLAMSFGDGFAGLTGRQINSPRWKILGQTKSLIGTLTMAITVGVTLALLNTLTDQALGIFEIIGISILATCLEQISLLGIDNLSVPISVGFCWHIIRLVV